MILQRRSSTGCWTTKPNATDNSSDENNVAVQSGPPSSDSDNDASFGDVAIIDTSTALDGRSFEACPSDFLQCEVGSFTCKLVKFFVMEGVNTDGVFCVSSDCCGASKTI